MFCMNCGKKIDDDSKFCPFCGSAIGGTTQSNGQASSMPAGSQTPNMLGRPVVKTAKKPISKNTVVGMVACLIAVLAIVGIVKVFSGVSNRSEVKRTNKELVAEVENVATETDKEINNPVNEINSDKDTDTGSKLVKTSFDWKQVYIDYFNTPSDSVPIYARNYNIVDVNLDGVAEVYIEEASNDDKTYSSSLYFINKDNMVDKITAPCPSQFSCFNNSLHIVYYLTSSTRSDQELVYAYNDETGSYDLVFDGIVDTITRQGKSISGEEILPAEYASALSEFWDENADHSAISSLGNGDAGKNGDFFDDSRFDANVIREALERWSEV